MRKSFKRLVSVVCMIAVVVCLFSGSAFAASVGTGGIKPPVPIDIPLPSFIQFDVLKLYNTTIPQGGSTSVYGFVIQARSTVTIKATVKKYYNSYSAYSIATYTTTSNPTSGIASFVIPLNLNSQSAGHYQVVVEAKEYGKTISKTLEFYIT